MERSEILRWLRESDPARLQTLWQEADATRRTHVGDDVQLRGLVEISNHCQRTCAYCGLRAPNRSVVRYRMDDDAILACAHRAMGFGYGTLVLQSGEDPALGRERVVALIRRLRDETPLAVTLSLGERSPTDLAAFRAAGADRYLLRFETSNLVLYRRIHPGAHPGASDRFALLSVLRALDYEVGSGVMIGIPGQTFDDLARDLEHFAELELDMIGVGPYLPHPATPMGAGAIPPAPAGEQVLADDDTTYRVIALARLLRPNANVPATTALHTLRPADGRRLGLERGANVIMPNLTPPELGVHYAIYPAKGAGAARAEDVHSRIVELLHSLGRRPGRGPGDAPSYRARHREPPALRVP